LRVFRLEVSACMDFLNLYGRGEEGKKEEKSDRKPFLSEFFLLSPLQ
jgi:hypothetical protein